MTNIPNDQNWRPLNIVGFAEHFGPMYRSTSDERPRLYGLQTGSQHSNPLDMIHGGVITSFLDQVIAIEAWNAVNRVPTVTIQMDTRFLTAAAAGDFLSAQATIEKRTKSLIFMTAHVSSNDAIVASANAIMKIAKPQDVPS